jgi:hypothetical protein
MPETLYIILRNGNYVPVTGVTALALDSTLTIKPGDFYRDEYVQQTLYAGTHNDLVITDQKGDAVGATPAALRTESWLCSYWKLTRGSSLPILRFRWVDVEAICDQQPNRVTTQTNALYVPLRSGNVAVISGVAASTTAVAQNTSMTIYPGDYYRNDYTEQTGSSGAGSFEDLLVTNQLGDTKDGDPLNSETWDASHMEFTRTGLLTLYIPERNVLGGPCTSYPNRVAA